MARIVAFSGSAREQSLNQRLLRIAVRCASEAGAEVTSVDLRELSMPLYDGDLEAASGLPENTLRLQQLLREHDGLLLACPEYNGSITPLLKNTIDWLSRPTPGKRLTSPFRGKTAALLSASPGAYGGMRGLVHVRAILSGMGVLVLPGAMSLGKAHEAFAEDGSLPDEGLSRRLTSLVGSLVETIDRLTVD